MRSVRLPSSAVCIAFVLVMGSVQVIADIDGGIAADLAALGYVMYNNLDYIPAPDDPGVTVRARKADPGDSSPSGILYNSPHSRFNMHQLVFPTVP